MAILMTNDRKNTMVIMTTVAFTFFCVKQ